MSNLLAGFLGVLLATNQPLAVSNLVQQQTGLSVSVPNPKDPAEQAFQKLMAQDDAAHQEVDRWIKDNQTFEDKGAGLGSMTLNPRIEQRLKEVREAYETFLKQYPNHARARTAYASFLSDQGDEEAALVQLEKAREADPKNSATWNNLGNYYGHNGEVEKAFQCYTNAIALNPTASVYFQNLATTMYMFRMDATNYFKIAERDVFDTSMALYRKALALDPENFQLATEYAQSYYGFRPRKSGNTEADRAADLKHWQEGLAAWQSAFKLARDDIERQGVLIHYARMRLNLGQFAEARRQLESVTNEMYQSTRQRILKNIQAKQNPAPATNAPAVELVDPAVGKGK